MVVTTLFAIAFSLIAITLVANTLVRHQRCRQLGVTSAGILSMACGCGVGALAFGGFAPANALASDITAAGDTTAAGDKIAPKTPEITIDAPGKVEYLTKNRPEWLDALPNLNGEIHHMSVSAGPFKDDVRCSREMKKELRKAVNKYIEHYLGSSYAPQLVRFSEREINTLVVRERFRESLKTSVGAMRQHHARLEFNQKFQSVLTERWKQVTAWSRLLQFGLGGAGLLGLLALMYGYFRVDTATRGYYTRRLQFAATAAILALIAAGVIMAKWIPWI